MLPLTQTRLIPPGGPLSLALVLTIAVLAGCGRDVPVRDEPVRPVRSVVIESHPVSPMLQWPAEIRPRIEIRYGFRVGGKVSHREVSVGERVAPGQVLARLDPQDANPVVANAQAALAAALTDSRLAAIELDRQRSLKERNFVSQAALDRQQATSDAAVSRQEAAQAQLAQARNALEFQTLRADGAGVVVGVDAEAGQVVAAGQSVIRVARAGEVEALVNVPERDMPLARGQRHWRVSVAAAGDRVLDARLRELSPVADPASRTYAMRLTLSGNLAGVELGMSAVLEASGEPQALMVLPLAALFTTDGQPRVWRVDPVTLTVSQVPVVVAGLAADSVRVASGLNAGDRVVTAGANLLKVGQKVRLLEEPAAAPAAAQAASSDAAKAPAPVGAKPSAAIAKQSPPRQQ